MNDLSEFEGEFTLPNALVQKAIEHRVKSRVMVRKNLELIDNSILNSFQRMFLLGLGHDLRRVNVEGPIHRYLRDSVDSVQKRSRLKELFRKCRIR